MNTFRDTLDQNTQLMKWFNMLELTEKHALVPIFDQVLTTTEFYNSLYSGFEVYITGSSLNLIERSFNDIDLMVVIPNKEIKKIRAEILTSIWEMFKNRERNRLQELQNDPRVKNLDLSELLSLAIDSLVFSSEIDNQNKDALLSRLGSMNEITRLIMDPERELSAIKVRFEGMLDAEKNKSPIGADGTHGYEYGYLVEEFLKNIAVGLGAAALDDQPRFFFQWSKSFSEGYGKTAGENNCHIYPRTQCTPVHLFLTTGVDQKKAIEKKDSFMLEYYSEHERMPPIKLY